MAIDAGTTGVTVLMVSGRGEILSKGYREFPQYFPNLGWVEHNPEEIWQATIAAAGDALADSTEQPTAIGITNQRETVVIWSKTSLASPRNAIVWQDRRTSLLVDELRSLGLEDGIVAKTGLYLDPYFSSSKLLWLSREEPELWQKVESGELVIGTVDSYLVARISGGAAHITDASNASRTQLLNIESCQWDDELLKIFNVPKHALPQVVPSYGNLAESNPAAFLGLSIPVSGIAGDQQAALFGQAAFEVGQNKCTYGTGAFILSNTGPKRVRSSKGLLTTVAWMEPDGEICYALEGSVFVAGAAVQWLRDSLQVIKSAADVEALANSVADTAGVVFVPALTGLGAPHWDPNAKGVIFGLTRGATKAHIARATLQAIAFQVKDVVDAIAEDMESKLDSLHVDGGAAANNLLMQMQADCVELTVRRGKNLETTGLGAAFLAGLGSEVWSSKDELKQVFQLDRTFEPQSFDQSGHQVWQRSVRLAREWSV